MDTLLNKFSEKVNGFITGFDRIIFKGMILPIMYTMGMESFLSYRKVLNKDFKVYAMAQSKKIVDSAEELSNRHCGQKIPYISETNERKEELAHDRQEKLGITEGLIGIWSCVESCSTFKSTYKPSQTYPSLSFERGKCKHLYFYFDDPEYGFMSVRLQTWMPYEIQISLNGRQWLRRSLEKAGCGYYANKNKILHIDDYRLAQSFLDAQAGTNFRAVLNRLLPIVFPRMPEILSPELSYYWTFWQSEVAKDYIFKNSDELCTLMDEFLIHALVTGKGGRILTYFGNPVKSNGQPHHCAKPEISSRAKHWYDGVRVRHWLDSNSVKFYNEHNVLRFEMTMNDPTRFMIYRRAENQCKSEPTRLMSMRKGVADTAARFEISKSIINRFSDHMSAVKEKARLGDLFDQVGSPVLSNGKRFRALDVFGKDKQLLSTIADPAFDVHVITNKRLQKILKKASWANGMSEKQLSARITRHLRLLCEHGLIKKLPNQRKYILTDIGRKLTAALEVASATSVDELLKLAA